MKIAVTGPTGNVGRGVADYLLANGANVRLLSRHPEMIEDFAVRGAEVLRCSLADETLFVTATRGVDALFWMTPPGYRERDLDRFQCRVGRVAAEAIRANQIPRVVNLSCSAADVANGNGANGGLHRTEQLLNRAAKNVTHLRPGYFFENYLWQLDCIRNSAAVYLPVPGSVRVPMIDSQDVARAAAHRLMDPGWNGRYVWGLHGPADLSFDEAAEAISAGSGRHIVHVEVSETEARQALTRAGLSRSVTESMLKTYRALRSGRQQGSEPRTPLTTTPTTLRQFTRRVLLPLLGEPATP